MEKGLRDQFPPSGLRGGEVIKAQELLLFHSRGKQKPHILPQLPFALNPALSVPFQECGLRTAGPNTTPFTLSALHRALAHFKYHDSLATSQWVCPVFRNPSVSKRRLKGCQLVDSSHWGERWSRTRGWNAESWAWLPTGPGRRRRRPQDPLAAGPDKT